MTPALIQQTVSKVADTALDEPRPAGLTIGPLPGL